MTGFLTRRLLQGVLVIVLIAVVTFFLINLAPGGPSSAVSFERTAQEREALLRQFGLDRPVTERFWDWFTSAVRGDLGTSLNQGLPVATLLKQRIGNTVNLALAALVLATVVGVLLGVVAALNRNRWPDWIASGISTLGMSIPGFWLGIIAIIVFSVQLGWLPSAGMFTVGRQDNLLDRLRYLVMPASVLAFTLLPNIVQVTRAALLEVLSSDFIRTARAKGLSQRVILVKHTFRNALVPILAMLGLMTTVLFSGSVVIESVFGWAGLGRLAIEAANGRDYPVVLGVTLLAGAIVVVVNIVTDILYAIVDPRVRHG